MWTRIKAKSKELWKKSKTVVITVIATLTVVLILGTIVGVSLLRFYVDGLSINRRAFGAPLRSILWETPRKLEGPLNDLNGNFGDAAISPDGNSVILSRLYAPGNRDLFIAEKKDGEWDKPRRLISMSTRFNELAPEWSRDGRYLFFASDRTGTRGGYDIWVSSRKDGVWTRPVPVNGDVNTKYDELDPALSRDSAQLLFVSNRPKPDSPQNAKEGDYDLYRSFSVPADGTAEGPRYGTAEYLTAVNSEANERKGVITSRGDIVYFSSDRKGGIGGYDLYSSHLINGAFIAPTNFGTPVNSRGNEMSPSLSLEGFGIYFSSDIETRYKDSFKYYNSISRQVVATLDYMLLLKLLGAILLTALTILAICYLLKLLLSDTAMKTIYKCLIASIIVHLILLVLSTFWFISAALSEALQPPPVDLAINVNNLARDSVALAIRESLASLPSTDPSSLAERLPIPKQSEPVKQQQSSQSEAQATVLKASVATVSMNPTSPAASASKGPPTNNKVPIPKMGHVGSNIQMESPSGGAKGDNFQQNGDSDGPPGPGRVVKKLEVKKIDLKPVPLEMPPMPIGDIETGVGKSTWKPALETSSVAVTSAGSVASPEGKDATAKKLQTAGPNAPKHGMPSSIGTLMFGAGMKMETGTGGMELPEIDLGMLTKDPNISKALELDVQASEAGGFSENMLREFMLKKKLFGYNPLAFIKLILDRNLNPVGGLIYANTPRLQMPADSEMEVPEHYTP